MPSFDVAIIVIYLLIVIIQKYFFNAYNRSVLIFDKFEQHLLLLTKKSHLWILINFSLLSVIQLLKPSIINYRTYPASNSH